MSTELKSLVILLFLFLLVLNFLFLYFLTYRISSYARAFQVVITSIAATTTSAIYNLIVITE